MNSCAIKEGFKKMWKFYKAISKKISKHKFHKAISKKISKHIYLMSSCVWNIIGREILSNPVWCHRMLMSQYINKRDLSKILITDTLYKR